MHIARSSPYGWGRRSQFGVSLDRDCPPDRDPQKEHGTRHRDPQEKHGTRHRDHPPQRNMGPGSQTGSSIIQKPPLSPPPSEQNDTRFLQYYLSTNFICNTVKHFRTLSQISIQSVPVSTSVKTP